MSLHWLADLDVIADKRSIPNGEWEGRIILRETSPFLQVQTPCDKQAEQQ